jgi:hypothetical protein
MKMVILGYEENNRGHFTKKIISSEKHLYKYFKVLAWPGIKMKKLRVQMGPVSAPMSLFLRLL